MSKVLLNYAVSFTEILGTQSASTAFLHQLGVVCKPSTVPTAVVIEGTGEGTTTVPAILTLTGLFQAGDVVDALFTSDSAPNQQAPLTITETMGASDVAILWADLIKGIDQLTARAVGNTVEIRAFNGGVNVLVENATYTPVGTPFEAGIITVTDPEQLQYYTDQFADIQGAFDAGLTRVYLVLVDDILDAPALLLDKECDFYTVYGSLDFTADEYIIAFAGWQGVKGFTTIDEVTGALYAVEPKQCVFYEDTLSLPTMRAYYGLYAFGSLLSAGSWANQQYIPVVTINGSPAEDLGTAELLFDERLSFYLNDEEQGTRLAFFVAGGLSITTPYINEELKVVMQSNMLNFMSTNQPMNIETNRLLLEQRGKKIINQYVGDGLLDPDGVNTLTITKGDEVFIVDGEMETTEAVALWRVDIDAKQNTGV